MAIKFQSLENVSKNFPNREYTYKDLSLDISQIQIITPGYQDPLPGPDIKTNYDLGAINNSLVNIVTTIPGQRFLFPEFGLNLYQYLFEPISVTLANDIGNSIYNAIKKFEPRVTPVTVNIITDTDNNQYEVTVFISVPVLGIQEITFNLTLDLKKQSLVTLPLVLNK
jgi:phage baseplate assembly protein W